MGRVSEWGWGVYGGGGGGGGHGRGGPQCTLDTPSHLLSKFSFMNSSVATIAKVGSCDVPNQNHEETCSTLHASSTYWQQASECPAI